jgi:hypothetical protein
MVARTIRLLLRVRDDVEENVGISVDQEAKAPTSRNAGLPDPASGKFLGAQ